MYAPLLTTWPFVGIGKAEEKCALPLEPSEFVVADGCGAAFETAFVSEGGNGVVPTIAVLTGKATDGNLVSAAALLSCVVGTEPSLIPVAVPVGSTTGTPVGLTAEDGPLLATSVVTEVDSSTTLLTSIVPGAWEAVA